MAAARLDDARRDRGSLWLMHIVTEAPVAAGPSTAGAAPDNSSGQRAGRGVAAARQDDAHRDRGSLWPMHNVTEAHFAAGPSAAGAASDSTPDPNGVLV